MKKSENPGLEILSTLLKREGFVPSVRRKYERNFVQTFHRCTGKHSLTVTVKPTTMKLELFIHEAREGYYTNVYDFTLSGIEKLVQSTAHFRF